MTLLTYDDVRLAGASAGICCEVALDLVSSLIEQVQVVLHWVSIMKALAQTDDAWGRKKTGIIDKLCGVQLHLYSACFTSDQTWFGWESVALTSVCIRVFH